MSGVKGGGWATGPVWNEAPALSRKGPETATPQAEKYRASPRPE